MVEGTHHGRRISGNGSARVCRFDFGAGGRHGNWLGAGRGVGAPEMLSSARLVAVLDRASQCSLDRDGHDPFLSPERSAEAAAETGPIVLCVGRGARHPRNSGGSRWTLYPARSRHQNSARAPEVHKLQGMDAEQSRSLVAGVLAGAGNLCPMVRTSFLMNVVFDR